MIVINSYAEVFSYKMGPSGICLYQQYLIWELVNQTILLFSFTGVPLSPFKGEGQGEGGVWGGQKILSPKWLFWELFRVPRKCPKPTPHSVGKTVKMKSRQGLIFLFHTYYCHIIAYISNYILVSPKYRKLYTMVFWYS